MISTDQQCATCEYEDLSLGLEPCNTCGPHRHWVAKGEVFTGALGTQVGGGHYQLPIQPVEFIVKNEIPYREGNAIKYIVRHRSKNGKQDIEKAIHYLQMILEDYDGEEV